eukprot:TRINITY_DN12382_c0_g1_i2.p3 TRINITY_DN12382_c0_g1~~TRINITY_DN12382_c0_g1_i2.p3  ORF type:complete len:124 (+),score=49.61 TRINITY_DN12382_c0_g1_i2:392-763(+)
MNHTIVRGDPLKEASEHLQMSPERLLEILGIDRSSFVSLPADLQHEALSMMIQVLPELGQAGEEKHAELQPSGVADAAVTGSMRGFGAQPAALTTCLLYTSDAADEEDSVDLGGRRIIKKKKK